MKQIAQALIAFQSDLKPLVKDAENPFFKSKYLDLSSILQDTMPLLSKHKLAMIQPFRIENGLNVLQTILIHDSGEMITSEIIVPHHIDPQKQGSLISYYKRYSLQSLLGIAAIDDDAEIVSQEFRAPATEQKAIGKLVQEPVKLASSAQLKFLSTLAQKTNTKIDNPEKLTSAQAAKLINELNGGK